MVRRIVLGLALLHVTVAAAPAQLALLDEFAPGLGLLVSAGFAPAQDRVWVYDSSGTVASSYSTAGVFDTSITRPGESANDVDIDFATEDLTLGTTLVPTGSMLFVNGETGTADVYAVDPATGTIITTLVTAFGNAHVVGGAWHPGRNTLFLVSDQLDSVPNTIAEIDPVTGAVSNSFGPGAGFTVNYGDLDVDETTGNLLLVSDVETTIRELTPTGTFVQDLALPDGVSDPSGIAVDDGRGEIYLSSTNGSVYRLGPAASTTTTVPTSTTTTIATTTTTIASTSSTVPTSTSTSTTATSSTLQTSTTSTTVPAASCEPLDGVKLLLTSVAGSEKQRSINLLSKDPDLTLGLGNGSADDPVLHGGSLRVIANGGDGFDDTYALAAERWKYVKKQGAGRGYKFRRTKPVKGALIQTGKRLTIRAAGPGLGHTLAAEPASVDVVLSIGGHCYCLRFDGDVTFKPGKKWLAKSGPAPIGCQVPAF